MHTIPFQDPALALWPRQPTLHMPDSVAHVVQPVHALDGVWKFHPQPPPAFWTGEVSKESWRDLPVPSTTFAQGYEPDEGAEYAYHRRIRIPPDFARQRIFLRFDGVTGKSRVWVNGQLVRCHYGGHTTWYGEITGHAEPDTWADLTVGITDAQSEVSVFNTGGIIRSVQLVAVPPAFLSRFHIETALNSQGTTATVTVILAVAHAEQSRHEVRLRLVGPGGQPVELETTEWCLDCTRPDSRLSFPVPAPVLWDAEHPHLYTLRMELCTDGQVTETVARRFGIRTIAVAGRELHVNGQAVKLRGVNRHDVHLLTGRTVTPDQVEADVRLFREANVNFIRTSHYPPREDFLDLCDEYGIYVEDEASVAFVYQFIQPTQNDPDFTAAYMDQFAEMIERDRSHPCVIMWSLANECFWGTNFRHEFDYAKAADPARPVIFSYPNTMPEGTPPCDIWSSHYANWDRDPSVQSDTWSRFGPGSGDRPVLHDEYAHIACYDIAEQRRDPAVREFWGESIKRWWERIFTTPGALGGAIWGGIDDEIITRDGYTTNREWGIIDGWRRRKPEHWLTRKAYSPVRLQDWRLPAAQPDGRVHIPLANWFDHTCMDELLVQWRAGDAAGSLPGPPIKPHREGYLVLPPEATRQAAPVHIAFVRPPDHVIDEFRLTPARSHEDAEAAYAGTPPSLEVQSDCLHIQHTDFRIAVSRASGMLTADVAGDRIIESGPHLVLTGRTLAPWQAHAVSAVAEQDRVLIRIAGTYGDIGVQFHIHVDGGGRLIVDYRILSLPHPGPRSRMLTAGMDAGGYREVGVAFDLTPAVDRIQWDRRGLWSVYPEDHIGRNRGEARRERSGGNESLRQEPQWPWSQDMRNYSLFGRYDVGGRGTHDFRAMKHNIRRACAWATSSPARFTATSAQTAAVRLEVLANPDQWVTACDAAVRRVGSWIQAVPGSDREWISNKQGDFVELAFTGTGICWIGATDMIYGQADVFLDGTWVACVHLYPGRLHGTARGETKREGEILFSQEDLSPGPHTLRLEVRGMRSPGSNNAYVSVTGFRVLRAEQPPEAVRFHILNAWNYPELTWGNYMKEPVVVEKGYANRVQARIHGA